MDDDTTDPREGGHVATVAAPGERATQPVVGAADDTMATGATGPRTPGARVELDQTLPAGAGRTDDDLDLPAGDPARYVVGRELARGGMGRILAARDRRLGRQVAIKELLIGSSELRARFEREARITAKLQHPAIVSLLEAGAWPGGEPFYVMKLVAGESLDKVIARRPTLDARLGLLPNVIAAVDALAYAHSTRVIHRDLKPANVLVGEFGETVVIDWGLAKDLAASTGEPDVAVGPYRAAPGQTIAGAVMGTPAYMPAEQALGEAVDERADVYALGAMLYHVLAGAPPYTGKTADEILDAVIAGPPPPVDARAAGVPPDLVTIVAKAMARAAADRYPTAKELAGDLKQFQTGQLVGAHHYSAWQLVRRWARRHRTSLAIAAAASVVLGVVGVVSLRRIVREQARTEQSRRDAEELMGFMLNDVRAKLAPLGRLDLLDDVAKKAVAYYEQRGESGSPADLKMRALALRSLGAVLVVQGHADQALREYRASMAIARTLASADPTNAEWQRDLAACHSGIGEVLRAQGDAAGALEAYRAAMAIREALVVTEPTSAERQQDLGDSHNDVGDVLRAQGNTPGALAEYRAAMTIAKTLAASDPTDAGRQRQVAFGHNRVGDTLRAQGDTAGALAAYRAAMAITRALAANDPKNANLQHDVMIGNERIGFALLTQGDSAGALAEYRAASAIATTLAANDPTNASRQRELSISHDDLGDTLRAQGDTAGALAEYRASMAIARTLAANDPTNAERQRDLSISHNKVGDALLAQDDAAGALAAYRAAMAIRATLTTNDPTNAELQRDLAISHENVGDALYAQDDAGGALAAHRAAMAIRETLAVNDPTNADLQRDLALSHDKVGDALMSRDDAASALAEYRTAMAIAHAHLANDSTNAVWQRDIAIRHVKLGDALVAQRDAPGGLAEYKAGLALAQHLQAKDPTNADLRQIVVTLGTLVATCCSADRTSRPRGDDRHQHDRARAR